ncbi:MAG: DNA alkylation repair protein [Bacteroidales bacterium]|nr:DNA alkylation repair protein [Bacteroidales bacterium]MCF8392001.1 DNA alkylation repair protein [Bacteroidales bacterium]
MTASEILKELESYGNEQTKKVLLKHGAKEPFFGVSVADLKKILKKTKKNHELSLELYNSGNSDAMYLAGLMADEKKITEAQLDQWADKAYWYYLSEYAVPFVAAETDFGFDLGKKWIKSDLERIASAGWATLSNIPRVKQDDDLDIEAYSSLLNIVEKNIHSSPNRVRYAMNGFVIAVGSYIKDLTAKSIKIASKIGKVEVYMGDTSCKVPLAKDYIQKVIDMGKVGNKRQSARC